MIKHKEMFDIVGTLYTIEEDEHGNYICRSNGSAIGGNGFKTRERARQYIFDDVVQRATDLLEMAHKRVTFLQGVVTKLGDDSFNLGRFRKE